jgi:hypothetical protein
MFDLGPKPNPWTFGSDVVGTDVVGADVVRTDVVGTDVGTRERSCCCFSLVLLSEVQRW